MSLFFNLVQNDSVDLLKSLEQSSVDLIVTDPPYEAIEKHRNMKAPNPRLVDWFSYFPDDRCADLFKECFRVLKENSHLYVFCNHESLFSYKQAGEKAGFKYWKFIVWKKNTIGMGYHYRAKCELIAFFEKGKRKLNSMSVPDVIDYNTIRKKQYPTQKPVDLCEVFIQQSTDKGELVVDPFMGSGSTGVAAIQNGRNFIGGDISERAVKTAQLRLRPIITKKELKDKTLIKSPLRYPGGKSKAIKKILPLINTKYKTFIEPMVGGGSIFLTAKQIIDPNAKYIINDLNPSLMSFWKTLRDYPDRLVGDLFYIKKTLTDGKRLFNVLKNPDENLSVYEEAIRFFVLNRITFSGTIEAGGYSDESFHKRFTFSSIERLSAVAPLLKGVEMYTGDYIDLLKRDFEDPFIFLDPPYLTQTFSRLYGIKGQLHLGFDHKGLVDTLQNCNYPWLMTYDDCKEIRDFYSPFANIISWQHQYSMDNYKKKTTKKGKEVFISNIVYC